MLRRSSRAVKRLSNLPFSFRRYAISGSLEEPIQPVSVEVVVLSSCVLLLIALSLIIVLWMMICLNGRRRGTSGTLGLL